MNAAEILEALHKLTPEQLEWIFSRVAQLLLQSLVDEADAAFEREGGVSLNEARSVVDSWATK